MSTRVVLYALLAPALALALAGCGRPDGGEVETVNEQGTIVVAALGDSIHAGSPYWDPDPDVRASYGDDLDEQSQWEYWAARKDARLSFRNCGVWGERTDEIAERLERCAGGAEVLVVQGGINDIAQGRDVEPAAENLRSMVRRGKELGLRVTIANVLPWNRGWPAAQEPISRLNELIDELARDEGVPVLPFYATLEHPDEEGRMRDEWTSDGDHPSVAGYRRLGELAFRLP
ncbi:MAG: GDSL-type esterase/lipase family protein [Actinomycetota bacterium]|nr:GDSL-type esterase/lipase family protein [Actinomycetota bacterium]